MFKPIIAKFVCISALLSGCAIRPDIQDVTRVDTYEVIKRIRCELRDAVREVARRAIIHRFPQAKDRFTKDSDFVGFDYRTLGKDTVEVFSVYADSVIGTEFTFDATEDNNVAGGLDVLNTFTRGTLGIGVGGSKKLSRNNVEKSRSIDTFEKIATSPSTSNNYCGNEGVPPVNFTYPITGKIGLEPVVTKFFDYNQSANLGAPTGSASQAEYSVTLKFTTTLKADVAAVAKFTPLDKRWQLAGVDGAADVSRSDIHTLSIVFVLPTKKTPAGVTIAEQRAVEELNYLRQRDDLRTFGQDLQQRF